MGRVRGAARTALRAVVSPKLGGAMKQVGHGGQWFLAEEGVSCERALGVSTRR